MGLLDKESSTMNHHILLYAQLGWHYILQNLRVGGNLKGKANREERLKIHEHLSSECYHKVPKTGWLIKNRSLFLTDLEAGSLGSVCLHAS